MKIFRIMHYFRRGVFILLLLSQASHAQQSGGFPKMTLRGVFDAGQPGAVIIKLYDESAEVLCYVLMPENAVKRQINGVWTYDGNNIGSISCVPSPRK